MFSLSELSVCAGALISTSVAVGCFKSGGTLSRKGYGPCSCQNQHTYSFRDSPLGVKERFDPLHQSFCAAILSLCFCGAVAGGNPAAVGRAAGRQNWRAALMLPSLEASVHQHGPVPF